MKQESPVSVRYLFEKPLYSPGWGFSEALLFDKKIDQGLISGDTLLFWEQIGPFGAVLADMASVILSHDLLAWLGDNSQRMVATEVRAVGGFTMSLQARPGRFNLEVLYGRRALPVAKPNGSPNGPAYDIVYQLDDLGRARLEMIPEPLFEVRFGESGWLRIVNRVLDESASVVVGDDCVSDMLPPKYRYEQFLRLLGGAYSCMEHMYVFWQERQLRYFLWDESG